ncbi:hypothetical protein TPHA_0J02470 [Tetrapisispora phaffii CBS 4417]|uniref:Thiamine phosphate synthase/TenI domain-containing protein n=1 Tax=Tetrapisispora phaffii (strain ATCC 24235 / CBS 4417 / NBRC 1672 / NRRL Y-8282 / UCD 70-5) TaxID=1071381 RepID=G8BYX5_TETPH|nr:hypothetical protein TPHA_0J02470 [Tetrapisispora phaffii CBS 4417]CCE65067.1 hypothetical protein TPHA_0J02470 [Tetrapisispora phaffii CBS 4417]
MGINKKEVDYSLYLVTDSTMLPEGTTVCSQVEEGLKNGVTIVQLREKDCDTKSFVLEARKVQRLCIQYNVPLIINDRIDVALAIQADGVHVGQSDMPIPLVRELVGPDMIVGWSVGNIEEVEQLARWGPNMIDNIGIGMVFPTKTKKNPKKQPFGPQGVISILDALEENNADWIKTVAIGGLHPDNIERVLYQCRSSNNRRALDGIAVVSDIMAAEDAGFAATRLRSLLDRTIYNFSNLDLSTPQISSELIKVIIDQVSKQHPLVQHVTNKVHQNFGANVTLAIGGSPIMSENPDEVLDLASVSNSALLLNTGTVAALNDLKKIVHVYNEVRRPIVFDPVGYSASQTRLDLNNALLSYGQYTCIKGNIGEILALAGMGVSKMRGVDSGDDVIDEAILLKATRRVAFKYKTIAVCTGITDIIVNGTMSGETQLGRNESNTNPELLSYITCTSGDIPIMGRITASGCSLGSTIATLLGSLSIGENAYRAVVAAVILYKTAGKIAANNCTGTGSFNVALLDELYQLVQSNNPASWDVTLNISS